MYSLKGKRIAVTGGAGLIGSHLVDELLTAGARVIVVDDFSKGMRSNLSKSEPHIEIREGDLENRNFAEMSLRDAQVVFHLASRAYGVGYSEKHHLEMLDHNERITNNVISVLARCRPERFVVTSSSCVYRDDGPDVMDEVGAFEGEPEMANWGYGWAKRFLEQKSVILCREAGISTTIVRPFNIYGDRYRWVGANSQAIPMLVKRILDGNDPVVVWGSGQQRRNYLHALDCARVMRRLVEVGHSSGPVNIGLESTVSIRELVEVICVISGLSPNIEYDRTKPEGRHVKSADVTRLQSIIGEFPISTISLEEGIRGMVGWYQNNFLEASYVANA